MQRLVGLVRRCVEDYHMIEDGDKIAVGVSGGKDSLVLLKLLAALRSYHNKKFTLQASTIDMGLGMDYSGIEEMCRELDVPYTIVKTEIGPIIFDYRKEKNPCSMCSKMRRGALNQALLDLDCNKLALFAKVKIRSLISSRLVCLSTGQRFCNTGRFSRWAKEATVFSWM